MRGLKPFVGPLVTFFLGIAMNLYPLQSAWASGICIGFAFFWGALALLSNKQLLRRCPWLLEWFPFLDPSGGFASAEQLTGSFIKGQQFRIALIAHDNEIFDRVFEDCVIHGPAVLTFSEYADCKGCSFALPSPKSTLHWVCDFEDGKTLLTEMPVGSIVIKQCIFKRCKFMGIGFVQTKESADRFNSAVKTPLPIRQAIPTVPESAA